MKTATKTTTKNIVKLITNHPRQYSSTSLLHWPYNEYTIRSSSFTNQPRLDWPPQVVQRAVRDSWPSSTSFADASFGEDESPEDGSSSTPSSDTKAVLEPYHVAQQVHFSNDEDESPDDASSSYAGRPNEDDALFSHHSDGSSESAPCYNVVFEFRRYLYLPSLTSTPTPSPLPGHSCSEQETNTQSVVAVGSVSDIICP
jgi:hypothetical protein